MYCRFCGKQIPDQAKFCPECGADLAPAPSAAPGKSPAEDSPRSSIAGAPANSTKGNRSDPASSTCARLRHRRSCSAAR